MTTLIRFLEDKRGATAVEYGLLASLISVAMIVGLQGFSGSLLDVFERITTAITTAGDP